MLASARNASDDERFKYTRATEDDERFNLLIVFARDASDDERFKYTRELPMLTRGLIYC